MKSSLDTPKSRRMEPMVPGFKSLPRWFGIVVLERVAGFRQVSWLPLPCLSNSQPNLRSFRVSSLYVTRIP